MAGYLAFATGQVLTAAQVNGFLMEQATMTFADDAARTTALASVLREGLLTYNLDTNRLEVYDGTAWVEPAPEPPAGIGSNVVSVVKTNAFTTTSGTNVDVTGVAATITPSSDTSKILVMLTGWAGMSGVGSNAVRFVLVRNSTEIANTATNQFTYKIGTANNQLAQSLAFMFLDSPATTAATTYKIQARTTGGEAGFVGKNNEGGLMTTTITVVEVAV